MIPDRRPAEERRREFDWWSTLATISHDAITVSTLDAGELLLVNERALALTGYDREQLVGQHAMGLPWVHPEAREAFVDVLVERGRIDGYAWELRTRSGETRKVESNAVVIDPAGRPCVGAVTRDLTWRHDEPLQRSSRSTSAVSGRR